MHGLLRAPAEAAAGQHGLELHALERQPKHPRNRLVLSGLELTAEARHRALAIPAQEAIERLHRRMGEEREYELSLDDPVRAGKGRVDVPVGSGDQSRPTSERTILRHELFAAAPLRARLVPRDAQPVP